MSTMYRSLSKGTCARHILRYSDQIAMAMSDMTGSCNICGPDTECGKCVHTQSHPQYVSNYSNDLCLSAINGTQHTYGDQSQFAGPLTSTVVQSPQYRASPECFRGYEYDATMSPSRYGWSHNEMDFRMVQRSEPSGSESTLNRGSSGYSSRSMCGVPSAPPCSFTSNVSQNIPPGPYNSPPRPYNSPPESRPSQPESRPSHPESLGPRPQCDGAESAPSQIQRSIHRSVGSRESLRSRSSTQSQNSLQRRVSRETVIMADLPESRVTTPDMPDLSIVSNAESFVGKRMCCIALTNNKNKNGRKSIGRKIKDFTKNVGQMGKSSKSSLQTLTVI